RVHLCNGDLLTSTPRGVFSDSLLGHLTRPSISAVPGSVIPWGTCVTFVCRAPPGDYIFRLEKNGLSQHEYVKASSGNGTEARFPITSVNKDSGGYYCCLYYTGAEWSERSELLELVVTAPTSQNGTMKNSVCMALAAVVLLILVVILAEAWHSQCRSQCGSMGWRHDGTSQV
ncbi:leukocyte-associated immunoglobulin-like receptor 2, partial [Echinops telfairi]|uniref:Leukocyte-associated immunoglobulin-like receptor 2 n=1 Tax=Echinops telfairi TaxID=9371 RepID=A0AC55D9A5_ECHTE